MSRVCEWCSEPLTGRQTVACSNLHRLKRHRWLRRIPNARGVIEEPPRGSALWLRLAVEERARGRERAAQRRRRGGLQVSVGRILEVLQGDPLVLPEQQARLAVARALSDRQRERFEGAA